MQNKQYYIYLATNSTNKVIYTGFTNNLIRRIYEHKHKILKGFTSKYNIDKLVYYEIFTDPKSAITREKQIKAGSRKKKINLIESVNSGYKDLYDKIASP